MYEAAAIALSDAVGYGDILWSEAEVWDIAGLIEDSSKGEGLGNEFLGHIKNCDAVVHVLRSHGGSAPGELSAARAVVQTELALFDHSLLLKPFEKARRLHRLYPKDTSHAMRDRLFSSAFSGTRDGALVSDVVSAKELQFFDEVGLLTNKPQVVLINGDDLDGIGAISDDLLTLSVIRELGDEEDELRGHLLIFFDSLSHEFIRSLELKVFYTVGDHGVGQWVISIGADASQCAALVHADFAESLKWVRVAQYDDFLVYRNWNEMARRGLIRRYGPQYVCKSGEILYFDVGGQKLT